jgi:hypothetical protein
VLSKPITPKSMNVLGHGLALPLNRQSLDLATGPLINFGGASAAYSLRDLNGRNPRIVRVRRASDNHERDFYKDGINSGELTNWVNSQIVPPLDIGVETSEGRIPVPEGGTSIGIPAAAYSLRNLSTTYTGNVVDVRRSSDDAEDSFTAAEVADGTLEAWVNTNFNVKTYDFSSGSGGLGDLSNLTLDGGESIAGVDDALKMSVVSTGSNTVHRCYQNLSALGGGSSLRITFKAYRPSSNVNSGKLGFSFADGFLLSNIEAQFFSADDTWEDFTFDANSGTSTRFYVQLSSTDGQGSLKSVFNGTTGDHVYIKDLKIDVVNSSGFVSKWYDQSGNDNHAIQGTAASQPKIVEGGSLVSGGNKFDGTNDFLTFPDRFLSGSFAISTVFNLQNKDKTNNTLFGYSNNGGFIRYQVNRLGIKISGGENFINLTLANNRDYVMSITRDASNLVSLYVDGSFIGSFTQSGQFSLDRIGVFAESSSYFLQGTMTETLIYNSDQSANRTAIEANIGETYGITGIPAYDNTVDGFVETWYDQSGNGNDATQSVAASQPKIVSAGVFLGEVDFDGVNDSLETTNSDLCNVDELSVFSVLKPDLAPTSIAVAFSCGSVVLNSSAYGGWRLNFNGYIDKAEFQTQAIGSSSGSTVSNDVGGSVTLISYVADFPDASTFANGQAGTTNTNNISPNNTDSSRRRFRIGCQFTFTRSGFYPQPIKEIILYTSDQSANRVAIETNINDHYNIY